MINSKNLLRTNNITQIDASELIFPFVKQLHDIYKPSVKQTGKI